MAAVRITVGAQADASLTTVYQPLYASTAKAKAYIASQGKASGKAMADGVAAGAKASTTATDQAIAAAKRRAAGEIASIRQVQAARNREHAQFLRDLKQQQSEVAKFNAAAAKDKRAAGATTATRAQRGLELVSGATRNLGGVARSGYGIAKDVTRGMGVDFDLSTLISRGKTLESTATSATISAFAGKGKTATAGDVKATIDAIRAAGDAQKLDYNRLAEGVEAFVAKSADLDTARKVLSQLGEAARATGTDVGDLVSAAGDVNKNLEDTPDKAERLLRIMRLVAKQGAMGNVEIKDLSVYMGRLASSAFMFEGTKDENIGILGALAQISMKGGASTAADATRAADAFARDVTKGKALERFQGAGIEVFANKEKTKLLSPEKIIESFLKKTGGSLDKMSEFFQNEMSKKTIKGFSDIYQTAGGGEAGIAAVRDTFKRFTQTLTPEQVTKAADLSKSGDAAKAQAFQNKLETMAASMGDRLMPALEKLEPTVLRLTEAFTTAVSWSAENPGKAISLAIVGSIAKAAVGTAVQGAITDSISSAAKGAGGGIASMLAKLGSTRGGLAITAGAVTVAATIATIEYLSAEASRGENMALDAESRAQNALSAVRAAKEGAPIDTKRTLADLEASRAELTKNLAGAKDPTGFFEALFTGKTLEDRSREKATAENMAPLQAKLDQVVAAINSLKSGIPVTNMPGPGSPGVDNSGRTSGVQ
jgi:hypothetical protein